MIGEYHNYTSSHNIIKLNADSTFNFRSLLSIFGTYVNGTWKVNNDTIFLKAIFEEKRPKTFDWEYLNLSVSLDKKEIVYTKEPVAFPFESDFELPVKLYYKKKNLYIIDENGVILKGYTVINKKKIPLFYKKEK